MNDRTKLGKVISLLEEEEKEKEKETKDRRFLECEVRYWKERFESRPDESERTAMRSEQRYYQQKCHDVKELCDLKATQKALEDTSHGLQSKIAVQEVTIVDQQAEITLLKNCHSKKAMEELREKTRQDIRDIEETWSARVQRRISKINKLEGENTKLKEKVDELSSRTMSVVPNTTK
jgi:hypothetical protein